jgi:hypothetical protein
MQNLEEAIRERAYHLWLAAGRPDGNSDAYWLDAQREVLTTAMDCAGTASAAAKPAKKPRIARLRKLTKRSAA